MHLMPHTPHRQHNKHNTHRHSRKRQIRLYIRKFQIQREQLDREADEKEEDEFEETAEYFVVKVVAVDFAVCAETFEDEPAKVFVDAVGEEHVEDLADSGDDGDYDEDGVEIGVCGVFLLDFVEELGDFRNLSPQVRPVTQQPISETGF
jgi:hypothetical protein